MKTIQVMMSTYNGEQYLLKQVESILEQKDVQVKLAIRDDGSTDKTLEILKELEKFENVEVNYGKNVGYKKSFLWLLRKYQDSAEYFAFCDQDDYWLPEKLNRGIECINEFSTEEYNLYYSNLTIVDESLSEIGKKKLDDRLVTLGSSISRSNIPGCTMIFNKKLAKKVSNFPENINVAHDALVQLVCLALEGNLFYDEESYILYRRHLNSLTTTGKNLLNTAKYEIESLKNKRNSNQISAKILLNNLNGELSEKNENLLKLIINYKRNPKSWINLLTNKSIRTYNKILDIYTYGKILLGVY